MIYKTREDLERIISLKKPQSVVDKFIRAYLQGCLYNEWIEAQRLEHSSLYPELIDGDPIYSDVEQTTISGYTQVQNPDYISFDDWMQETMTVELQPSYTDDEGVVYPAVTEEQLVRSYEERPIDVDSWKSTDPLYRSYLKAIRQDQVDRIIVTTNSGHVFDGDEVSQTRMARAIVGLPDDTLTIPWVLADNTVIEVNRVELQEALRLAGSAQATIWVI